MLAFQHISRFFVIEGLDVPLDQRKVFPVVLRVASSAFLAGTGWDVIGSVQPLPRGEPCGNLGVTIQTFQRRLPAKLVATGAISRPVERLVRLGEWSGRNLCRRRR